MADDIVVNIAFKGNATDFLAELSRQANAAKRQLEEIGQSSTALSRAERVLAQMSAGAKGFVADANKAAQATQGWSQKWTPFKGQFLEAEAASKGLWKSIDSGIASAEKSLARGTKAAQDFQNAQSNKSMGAIQGAEGAAWDKQFAALSKAADENTRKLQQAKKAVEDYQNSLSNARYVLYDVAGTLSVLGIGLVAPLAGVIGVAINFQKEFAQVARTSGVVGSELQSLKGDFDDLYGSIPITYEALAKIATLAGQLGVPADRIAAFTETVAKTSAVTDLSVEQAATAFGRLDALIPNVKGQYDRLGSSIALVGVKSVATESQIVNIATQISSMGSFAGLTAQDVIGLSGALASIGAQPELSRGTVTRVFTLMSRAVAQGGADLDKFAQLSGVSADKFKSTWGTPEFAQTFIGFMKGIQNEGGNAVAALNDLGITSVRDVPLLTRLANAADSTGKAGALLASQIGYANQGWEENIELQRQFEIISNTVAGRMEVLSNNFNLLLQAVGGPLLDGLGDFVNFLGDAVKVATDLAQTDLGGSLARVLLVMTALLGVVALAGGAMALFGASSIGVYQALQFISVTSPKATAGLLGTAGAAALADGSLKAGAASALLFGRALKAFTIVGALLILPEVLKGIGGALDDLAGNDYSNANVAIEQLATSSDLLFSYWRNNGGIERNFGADFANGLTAAGRAAMALDDQMKGLVADGNVKKLAEELNQFDKLSPDVDAGGTLELFHSVIDAAKEAGFTLEVVNGKIAVTGKGAQDAAAGTDVMGGSLETLQAEADAANAALDELKSNLDAIGGTQMTAGAAMDALYSSINQATAALNEGGFAFAGTDEKAIAFRGSLRDIEGSARDAALAILENKGSIEEANGAYATGRERIIDLIAGFFDSREAAAAWADANYGASTDVINNLAAVGRSIQNIPKPAPIVLITDTAPAYAAINAFIWSQSGRRINLYVDGYVGRQVAGSDVVARAGGGPINGPGSDTSDSILARLSNNEYVIRAKAAKALGSGRLDYMNRYGKLPAFASGGSVGGSSGDNVHMPTEVDLSARSIRALSRKVINMISIDNQAIAGAANAGNANRAGRGSGRG